VPAMAVVHPKRFKNRKEAGQLLARRLGAYAGRDDAIVLALPRGGVPVGVAIADKLKLEFDILLVRKLGFPWQPELAMGAVASGGLVVLHDELLGMFHVPAALIEAQTQRELQEIARREQRYRRGRPAPALRRRHVILVDDGMATGSTMRAAAQLVRRAEPARLIVAVPVSTVEAHAELAAMVDEVVCMNTPEPFYAVGAWYRDFEQVSDEEVEHLLERIWRQGQPAAVAPGTEGGEG
jgi:putative phosphoribosyl transferase